MSRNACSNENGRFDKFLSNGVNVHVMFGNLANFSQICQSQISLADLTILTNFRHLRYCMHFWTYRDFCTTPYYCKTKPKSQMDFNVFLYMICT